MRQITWRLCSKKELKKERKIPKIEFSQKFLKILNSWKSNAFSISKVFSPIRIKPHKFFIDDKLFLQGKPPGVVAASKLVFLHLKFCWVVAFH